MPISHASPRWLKWLFVAGAMLLVLVSWKKLFWLVSVLWAIGKETIDVIYSVLQDVLRLLNQWMWKKLSLFNMVIGSIAIGPGLWLAGQLGDSFSGTMLLLAVSLFVAGAYCHWRESVDREWAGRPTVLHFRYGALFVALGCAIWSLRHYKLSDNVLWGFLPLLGAIYILLPVIYHLSRQLVLHNRYYLSLASWLILTITLYVLGLLVKAGGWENYFFTIGALTAVFVIRAGLLVLEPRYCQFFAPTTERAFFKDGGIYFCCALVSLIAAALSDAINFKLVAEQFAVIVYYCLLIGLLKQVTALHQMTRHTYD